MQIRQREEKYYFWSLISVFILFIATMFMLTHSEIESLYSTVIISSWFILVFPFTIFFVESFLSNAYCLENVWGESAIERRFLMLIAIVILSTFCIIGIFSINNPDFYKDVEASILIFLITSVLVSIVSLFGIKTGYEVVKNLCDPQKTLKESEIIENSLILKIERKTKKRNLLQKLWCRFIIWLAGKNIDVMNDVGYYLTKRLGYRGDETIYYQIKNNEGKKTESYIASVYRRPLSQKFVFVTVENNRLFVMPFIRNGLEFYPDKTFDRDALRKFITNQQEEASYNLSEVEGFSSKQFVDTFTMYTSPKMKVALAKTIKLFSKYKHVILLVILAVISIFVAVYLAKMIENIILSGNITSIINIVSGFIMVLMSVQLYMMLKYTFRGK